MVSKIAQKSLASLTMLALAFGTFGTFIPLASAATTPVSVTIEKYIDGTHATAVNANSADFPMLATYTIGGVSGGPSAYALSASGYNGDPTPYQAMTVGLTAGDNYATNEDTTGTVVGADCTTGQPFSLVGYTSGDTLAAAAAATPAATPPSFTNLANDKFVIVWNHDCSVVTAPATVTVTVNKYVDGVQATAGNAASADFPMIETTTLNGSASTGNYDLNTSDSYQAVTSDMAVTSVPSYTTSEVTGGVAVGADCTTNQPFALVGYTSGDTLAAAAAATPTATAPSFTGMTGNKFVIVWNHDCATSVGTIGGDVSGGTSSHGTLGVTSIDATKTSATADGTFTNGWKYVFHITVPDNETNVAMKFADWMNTAASSTLAASGNMRISSAQADNAGATVLITGANTYSTPSLHMTGDLDPATPGKQVEVTVEVAVPASTVNGSYATSYGVQTLP